MKALAWEDVLVDEDTLTGYITVKCNLDRDGKLKPPKTKSSIRKVSLLPATVLLLARQKRESFNQPPLTATIHFKHGKTEVAQRRRVFLSRNTAY